MKVGIVTINSINYGNRLQNYALQEILRSLGLDVDTIKRSMPDNAYKRLKKGLKFIPQSLFGTKNALFAQFDKKIKKSSVVVTKDYAMPEAVAQYDYFIAGSDQVWNPYYDFIGKNDFLDFARPEQRISYAASFGVSELPEAVISDYKNYLMHFHSISMREQAGADIVKQLTGKEVEVVLDPTMLLKAEEWRKIQKKPKNFQAKDYVLVYNLGKRNEFFQKTILDIEQQGKFAVIDIKKKNISGREPAIGPAEFLYLIDHAKLVLTDSFHGTVFSLLFHTNFFIFEREGIEMGSRIKTLLKMTGADQRRNINKCDWNSDPIDFDLVDKKIEINRAYSIRFLCKALKINN